ncbi:MULTISPECIES: hypothetical protein [Treponema]|jgi:hypothetical protein|uniref:DUF4386 domain-containing protein n=1 Tax=Treponema rectale TaxID=744512 RepID=A0A840SJG0_9SPIR|nr:MULTISPECIES: hypothetical protein [Treponema]MBB5219623.1 hypothetical protein [Treponema rectale]MBE6353780.1 hypothetical protein [Treponema sp.]MBO6176081.1 hypothetical protein [Treponema sp.]
MANKKQVALFWTILNLAVGCFLAIGGIYALQGGGDPAVDALKSIIENRSVENVVVLAFGVIELLSGLFIIIQTFIGDRFGKFGSILKLVIVIVWIVAIVLGDFFGPSGLFKVKDILAWVYRFAQHLIVLCALLVTRD